MNLVDLKEKIKIAHEAVSDESEPYKIEAFKIILKRLVQDHSTEKQNTSGEITSVDTSSGEVTSDESSSNIVELATKCEISVKELEDVITIKNCEVELIAKITGK